MSQHAKTVVAAIAAVLLAGVQAWQTTVDGQPFHAVDALPIAIAVVGAVLIHVIPNTGDQPVAKAVVAGALAALNAAGTVLAGESANATALNLGIAALGALATWYVPKLAPELAAAKAAADVTAAAAAGKPLDPVEITDALKQLEQLDPAQAAPDPTPATVEIPVQPPATPAALAAEPTPIADAALAAAHTSVLAAPNSPMAG